MSAVRIIALLGSSKLATRGDNAMEFSILRGVSKESKLDRLKKWLNNNKITYYDYLVKCNRSQVAVM